MPLIPPKSHPKHRYFTVVFQWLLLPFSMIFVSAMMFAFCCLLIRQFGCATIMGLIYSICALPLPVIGTTGFLPKILIGFSAGVAADLTYFLLKKNVKIAAICI